MRQLILLLLLILFVFPGFNASAQSATNDGDKLTSPDGETIVTINLTDRVYYSVMHRGEYVIWSSPISMELANKVVLGKKPKLLQSKSNTVRETIEPVWGIRSQIKDHYNELRLDFEGNFSLVFRAYDGGVAYRFETRIKSEIEVMNEEVEYRFLRDYEVVSHVVADFQTSYEKFYTRTRIGQIQEPDFSSLPFIVDQNRVKVAIVESDLFDYPGMYLMKKGENNRSYLNGIFPKYPLADVPAGWCQFNLRVTERANFIAKTNGTRTFPWRAMVIADNDLELADNDLVYQLARPAAFETSWIKPGKVAWDWWNDWNLEGVDFQTGINNRTYEYYIDFAAKNKLPYIILDEGWSDQFDLLLQKPGLDVPALVKYANERNVKIILWCVWHTMDRQMDKALSLFGRWGIAGVKVDFIDRDDQVAVNFYERLAREAAKHKLLVDYHGCSKPTGLHRTYPNVINYEAVRGNEYNKFSEGVPPDHNVMLVYTRMIAGPMDYTPGAMRNSIQGDFKTSNSNTMSHGTRCHQLGMYVCYYAPVQMLCDAPTQYEKCPDILKFLSDVPVSWEDTKVLAGEMGKYVVIARRKGNDWYIGALNDWTERTLKIDLSFLDKNAYDAIIFQDGVNANKKAEDYKSVKKTLTGADSLEIVLKKRGGAAVQLVRK